MNPAIDNILPQVWVGTFGVAGLLGLSLFIVDILIFYQKGKNQISRSYRWWQTGVAVLFDFIQFGLFVAGAVLKSQTSHPDTSRYEWLDMAALCTLQLFFGTNVRVSPLCISLATDVVMKIARFFYIMQKPLWMMFVMHSFLFSLTTVEVAIYRERYALQCPETFRLLTEDRRDIMQYLYGVVLIILPILPIIFSCIAFKMLQQHIYARGNNPRFKSLLKAFIVTYVITALCELVGGVTLLLFASLKHLKQRGLDMRLSQVIIIVRSRSLYADNMLKWRLLGFHYHRMCTLNLYIWLCIRAR
jgi:uncharacterized membrane protein